VVVLSSLAGDIGTGKPLSVWVSQKHQFGTVVAKNWGVVIFPRAVSLIHN